MNWTRFQTVTGRPDGEECVLAISFSVLAVVGWAVMYAFLGPLTPAWTASVVCLLSALGTTNTLLGEQYADATCEMAITAVLAMVAAVLFALCGKNYVIAAVGMFLFAVAFLVLTYKNFHTKFPAPFFA